MTIYMLFSLTVALIATISISYPSIAKAIRMSPNGTTANNLVITYGALFILYAACSPIIFLMCFSYRFTNTFISKLSTSLEG